ncbi:hypothetical protein NC651_040489 [Populus alba x Populus x berolinensis]|nr:hypothetical protein NC651_040489 [Populus alba x Populus x berolinensis]
MLVLKNPAVQCCNLASCTFFHGLSVSNQRLHLSFFKNFSFFSSGYVFFCCLSVPLACFFENYGGN